MKKLIPSGALLLLLLMPASALPPRSVNPQAVPLPSPLSLEKALDYALEHNPALNRVREQVREQEGLLITVNANRLPQLTASAQQRNTDKELLSVQGGVRDSWQIETKVTQVLYAGGALQANSSAQRARTESARLAVQAQVAETVLAVRSRFAEVLLNRELIQVQEQELAVLEKEAVDAQAKHDAGTGSDFDLLRSRVAVANARPLLLRARNDYQTSLNGLRRDLGAPGEAAAGEAPDLVGNLEPQGKVPLLGDCLSAALASRPELLAQDQLQKAADKGIRAAKAGYQPTLSAFAAYDWASNPYSTAWNRRADGATVGLVANLNIFDGRATAGKVRQARSQARQVAFSTEELTHAVDYEVRTAHAALVVASELLKSADMTVTQAEESLRLARTRQAAGVATQLDVLSAQSALTQARSTLSNARYQHIVAMAQLEKATGRLRLPSTNS